MAAAKDGNEDHPPQIQNDNQIKHGERLLPQVIDTWAAEDPDHIVGMMAKSNYTTTPLPFINLTISQLANAINYTSHWLDKTLSPKPDDAIETIAFIGLQDFRYLAMTYASIKTGRRLLLPRPRNALPNTISLLNTTQCTTLFYTGPLVTQAEALKRLLPDLNVHALPSLDDMITSPTPHYLYTKTVSDFRSLNFLSYIFQGVFQCQDLRILLSLQILSPPSNH